ncbi:MAG: hypothetical protein Q7S55_03940 [Nanoarchaeota archaeon]|nr:hypothetical protein [Nanoarchaeota archaeon]
MLNKIINALVVRHNVRKIAPKGDLHSVIEDGPSYGSAGLWQGFPCYRLDFLFNDYGIISHAGKVRYLPPEEISHHHYGSFLVAVDTAQFVIEARRRNHQEDLHNERICSIFSFTKTEAISAKENIAATAELWNKYYGFDPDHDGFTVGNALDGEAEGKLNKNCQLY